MSRIAEDLVIWSTSEFNFVELADEFTSPSSVMPQKKNPDILEITRGKAARVIGDTAAVMAISKGLASGYGRDLQEIKSVVWRAARISVNALQLVRSVIITMKVNQKQMKKASVSGNLIALDIAEKLVMKGVAFRVAHKIVGSLVHTAHVAKKPIRRLDSDDILNAVEGTGVQPHMVSGIISVITVNSSIKDRKSFGSSGYAEQKRMIADRVDVIGQYREILTKRESKINASIKHLKEEINEIVNTSAGE